MARAKPPEIKEAEKKGHMAAVLPPEPDHPYPTIGWRLFVKHQNAKGKWVWVHVQFGAKIVLDNMVNASEGVESFNNHLAIRAKAIPLPKEQIID